MTNEKQSCDCHVGFISLEGEKIPLTESELFEEIMYTLECRLKSDSFYYNAKNIALYDSCPICGKEITKNKIKIELEDAACEKTTEITNNIIRNIQNDNSNTLNDIVDTIKKLGRT